MIKAAVVLFVVLFAAVAMQGTAPTTQAQTPTAEMVIDASDQPGSDPTAPLAQIDYSIVVFNNSAVTAQDVVLTFVSDPRTSVAPVTPFTPIQQAPANFFTFATGPNNAGFTTVPRTITPFNNINVIFSVITNVGVPNGDVLVATSSVSSSNDGNPNNNVSVITTTVGPTANADLRITKSAPTSIRPGTNFNYTLTVTNLGPMPATTVTLTDLLPANAAFTSVSQLGGPAWTITQPPAGTMGGTLTLTMANVPSLPAAGSQVSFSIRVLVPQTAVIGNTFTNNASINAASPDPAPANNAAQAIATVDQLPSHSNLRLTKTASPSGPAAGTNITYTINVINNGPVSVAQDTQIFDTTPPNTTFVSTRKVSGPSTCTLRNQPAVGGTGEIRWRELNLGVNVSCVIEIIVQVNPGTPDGTTITNTATVTEGAGDSTFDPDLSDNTQTASVQVGGVGVPPPPPPPPPPTGGITLPTGPVPTPVPPPTPIPFGPVVPPVIPQVFQNPVAQGIINGSRNNTPVPAQRPAQPGVVLSSSSPAAPLIIRPPSTGDAGLLN